MGKDREEVAPNTRHCLSAGIFSWIRFSLGTSLAWIIKEKGKSCKTKGKSCRAGVKEIQLKSWLRTNLCKLTNRVNWQILLVYSRFDRNQIHLFFLAKTGTNFCNTLWFTTKRFDCGSNNCPIFFFSRSRFALAIALFFPISSLACELIPFDFVVGKRVHLFFFA